MADAILASSGIYAIRNKINGKVYVGSSTILRRRASSHFRNLKRGAHQNGMLQNAVIKHGIEAFAFEILEEVSESGDLLRREQFWIDELRACEDGYNLRAIASSNLGMRHTNDAKGRISKNLSQYLQNPDVKARMSAIRTGMKRSEVTRERIGAAHRGKTLTAEQKQNVRAAALLRAPQSEESKKRRALSMVGRRQGSLNKMARMTDEKVRQLRIQFDAGTGVTVLAQEFLISIRQARDIAKRKAWGHVR